MAEDSQDLGALTAKIAEHAGAQTETQKEMVNELHMINTKDDGVNKLTEKEEKREEITRDKQKIEGIRSLKDPLNAIADNLKNSQASNSSNPLSNLGKGGLLSRILPKKGGPAGVIPANTKGKGSGPANKLKNLAKTPGLKGGMIGAFATNLKGIMKLFLKGGLIGIIATALYGIAQMSDKDGSRMTETTDKLKLSLGKIREELEPIWLSLKESAEDIWKKTKHFFTRIGEIFEKLAPILGTAVLDMVDILGPTLVDMVSGIADIVDGIVNMDLKKMKGGLNELMVGKDGNGGLINGLFGIAWKAVQGLSEGLIGVKLPDFPGFERLVEGIKQALWDWAGDNNLRLLIPDFLAPKAEKNKEYVGNLNKMSSLDQEISVSSKKEDVYMTDHKKQENEQDIREGKIPRNASLFTKGLWEQKYKLLERNKEIEKDSVRGMFGDHESMTRTPKQSMVKQLDLSKNPDFIANSKDAKFANAQSTKIGLINAKPPAGSGVGDVNVIDQRQTSIDSSVHHYSTPSARNGSMVVTSDSLPTNLFANS
jgi:hypothetical protein